MADVCVIGAGPGRAGRPPPWPPRPGSRWSCSTPAPVPAGSSGATADPATSSTATCTTTATATPVWPAPCSAVDYRPRHQVWAITDDEDALTVHAEHDGRPVTVRARRLVLAPGAYDRQIPFPGWTLPGVITAGAAQALLKEHGVAAGQRVLVAGTGPFLLPVATGLAARGAHVLGVLEAAAARDWARYLRVVTPDKAIEAAGYAARLARHRIPVHRRHVVLAAHGDDQLSSVTVARLDRHGAVRPGTSREIPVDTLAIGWGFTPQLELPVAAGCELVVGADGEAYARVDTDQRSSAPRVFVAGEATGIGGAPLAVAEGRIAGAHAAADLTGVRPDAALALEADQHTAARARRFAAAMNSVHRVPDFWTAGLDDATVVCRCEEVPAAAVHAAADLGARDLRSAKLLSRAGMGWCQGRVCGYATSCLIAARTGVPRDPRQGHERPIATPVPLRVVAAAGGHHPEGETRR